MGQERKKEHCQTDNTLTWVGNGSRVSNVETQRLRNLLTRRICLQRLNSLSFFRSISSNNVKAFLWKQAIYFLPLRVFHKRSDEERNVLEQILTQHHGTFGLTEQEINLMQTLAEQYLQQGIE